MSGNLKPRISFSLFRESLGLREWESRGPRYVISLTLACLPPLPLISTRQLSTPICLETMALCPPLNLPGHSSGSELCRSLGLASVQDLGFDPTPPL